MPLLKALAVAATVLVVAAAGLVALGHFFGRVTTLQAGLVAGSLIAVAVVVSWPRAQPAHVVDATTAET